MKKKYIFPAALVLVAGYYFLVLKKKDTATLTVIDDGTDPYYNPNALYDPMTGKPLLPGYTPPKVYTPTNPVPVIADSVRDQYLRSLKMVITDPAHLAVFDKMTNDELAAAWYYVGTYLQTGTPLLNATKQFANGTFDNSNPGNPGLYSKITAIHTKYGIF